MNFSSLRMYFVMLSVVLVRNVFRAPTRSFVLENIGLGIAYFVSLLK